jgi:hypothetical protein
MKLPAMNELLRIIAAAGITLLVVALAIMFFMWVFSSADREHRRVQPLAVSSSAERSRSISASWRINFAHFQPNHRQHHNDGGQSHRKSNQYTQPLSPQLAADIKSGRSWAAPPSAPGSASRPTVRPTSAEGRDPAGGTTRQSNRARQYPRTQGLFMLELG